MYTLKRRKYAYIVDGFLGEAEILLTHGVVGLLSRYIRHLQVELGVLQGEPLPELG